MLSDAAGRCADFRRKTRVAPPGGVASSWWPSARSDVIIHVSDQVCGRPNTMEDQLSTSLLPASFTTLPEGMDLRCH
ncbi:hypothetical protein E2C01_089866 [Portunus trituberculatus]|uniref:Uncharacterized protein n=1 Tax=Portunus trituberculatus TaxID=210409 RepID=A0A5B7JK96_PORTR|nr:hypothetical protein [Portunus trituberculatus]